MFTDKEYRNGYGDYRESIGRPRTNANEDLKESIPFNHFKAGAEWAIKTMCQNSEKNLTIFIEQQSIRDLDRQIVEEVLSAEDLL